MVRLDKGKQRAGDDQATSDKAIRQSSLSRSQRESGKADSSKTRARTMQRNQKPSSSSSSKRQQNLSPPATDSESESDDLDLEHESEDEFEQYRNEAAPSYAQYQGDSDLDEAAGDDSEDDQSGVSGSDAGSMQEEEMEEEHNYLDGVQAGMSLLLCYLHRMQRSDICARVRRFTANTAGNTHQSSEKAEQALETIYIESSAVTVERHRGSKYFHSSRSYGSSSRRSCKST